MRSTQHTLCSQITQVASDRNFTDVEALGQLGDRGLPIILDSLQNQLLPFFLKQVSHITTDKVVPIRNQSRAYYIIFNHKSQYPRSDSDSY
jgi:hypothetical protein